MRPAALLALGLVLAAFAPAMAGQAQTPSPNLAVTHVGWDQLTEGEATTFNATVTNQGDAAYDQDSFEVELHLEDAAFSNRVTVELEESMAPGESRNVSASKTWDAAIGQYTLNGTVYEQTTLGLDDDLESDDHRNRTFQIGPDIVAEEVRHEPSGSIAGQNITFLATIENRATDEYDVTDPFIVTFEILDEQGNVVDEIESEPITELRAKDPEEVSARAAWTSSAGSYTVRAHADADDNITEAAETNNTAEASFSVKPAKPDLVVTDVGPANPNVEAGEQTPIVATIENQGTANVTSDFPVRFRINGTTHGPDIHVPVGDALQPGATVKAQSEAWLATKGHHDLVAVADPGNNNVTEETKLGNNERSSELHVGPDLVVADILFTPDPPAAGYEVSIEPVIRNQGTANVTQNTTVEVAIPSEDETWTAEIGPLAAGDATQVAVAEWTPPEDDAGDYPYEVDVQAAADVGDEADEVDDENNDAGRTMEVTQPLPDVVTDEITLDPSSPAVGEDTTIRATIRNAGSADAEEVNVGFLVDGEKIDEATVAGGQFDSLAADGGTRTVSSDAWEAELGEHEIKVHPSLPDDAREVREDNNNGTLEALIGPDLAIEGVQTEPAEPEAEDEVTFEVTVANEGTEAVDEARIDVRVGDTSVGNGTVEDLAAGTNTTISVNWTAVEGDHNVRAIADADDQVQEAREDNNEGQQSFSTTASPDLRTTSIRWSEDPRAGDKLVFSATVANVGTADVQGSFTVSFHVGDEALGTVTVSGLAEGTSKSVSSDAWTATAGTHTVRVAADAGDDAVTESDETNNERTALVTVGQRQQSDETDQGPPNLVVSGLSAPDEIGPGDEVTFLATIENTGGQPAPASEVRFLVDGEVYGEPAVDRLEPGQRQSVTSEAWNATDGEHEVRAIADVRNDVDEADEEDNERLQRIQVGTPDDEDEDTDGEDGISLGAITVGDVRAGETVRPTVEVTNEGSQARDVTVTFYVDGTQLGEATATDLGPGETTDLEGPEWQPTSGEHSITAQAEGQRTETLVEVSSGDESNGVPAPGLAGLAAALGFALAVRRRGGSA